MSDTGSLRGDVRQFAHDAASAFKDPLRAALVQAFFALPADDGETRRRYWARRYETLRPMFDRAERRGEKPPTRVFAEALASLSEYEKLRSSISAPILANVTEFGKNELLSVRQLQSVGVDLAIYPVSLLRLAMGILDTSLDVLRNEGSLQSLLPQMQTPARLYELLDYTNFNEFDGSILDFDLP